MGRENKDRQDDGEEWEMSDIKEHVVSFELARELKEEGFKQDTCFYWRDSTAFPCPMLHDYKYRRSPSLLVDQRKTSDNWYAAPLATEIMELLPYYCKLQRRINMDAEWECVNGLRGVFEKTPADACAKMWLTLKKEKVI